MSTKTRATYVSPIIGLSPLSSSRLTLPPAGVVSTWLVDRPGRITPGAQRIEVETPGVGQNFSEARPGHRFGPPCTLRAVSK